MADIDKSLPNVKTSIEVNPQEEIEIQEEQAVESQDPSVEVTPNEDGSVQVDFEPGKVNIEGTPNHFDNLAELLPAEGPVRTQIVGNPDQQKEAQSQRVKDYMNYELMEKMQEYEPEFDQMLFHLPLAGSTFKKFTMTIYWDELFLSLSQQMI